MWASETAAAGTLSQTGTMGRRILAIGALAGVAALLGAIVGSVLLLGPRVRARSLPIPTSAARATAGAVPAVYILPPSATSTGSDTSTKFIRSALAARPSTSAAIGVAAQASLAPAPPATAPARTALLAGAYGSATAAPTTTIAPLGNSLPPVPATLPLRTRDINAHVSPLFAILSGVGFALALLIVVGR